MKITDLSISFNITHGYYYDIRNCNQDQKIARICYYYDLIAMMYSTVSTNLYYYFCVLDAENHGKPTIRSVDHFPETSQVFHIFWYVYPRIYIYTYIYTYIIL